MFSALVVMFGSAFLLVKVALISFEPTFIVFIRLFIASLLLTTYCVITSRKMSIKVNDLPLYFMLALTGSAIPFTLISWGQKAVSSGTAGILMATMPLVTIVLSHFFTDEEAPLNFRTVAGFLIGFIGVVTLLAGGNLLSIFEQGQDNLAKFAILSGAFSYAINAILSKRVKKTDYYVLSAFVLLISTIQMGFVTYYLNTYSNIGHININSILSLFALGIFSTAAAAVLYYKLINITGPSFMSLVNYPVPVWAVLLGVLFLGEEISWYTLISLTLILIGIALTQTKRANS